MEQQAGVPPAMPQWAQPVLERLLAAYNRHFDVHRDHTLLGVRVPAFASFHSRGEKYVLVKKAKLWAIECHEHVVFAAYDHFTYDDFQALRALLEAAESELVVPHSEHMYTYISAIVLAGAADPEAVQALRRYKFRKSYRFSLQGWCHARMALFLPDTQEVFSNADGKELRETITRALIGPKKRSPLRMRR